MNTFPPESKSPGSLKSCQRAVLIWFRTPAIKPPTLAFVTPTMTTQKRGHITHRQHDNGNQSRVEAQLDQSRVEHANDGTTIA